MTSLVNGNECKAQTRRQFTKQQIEDMREAFNLFDKDKDGRITCSELLTVMKELRQQASEDEIKDMITHADEDGNGTVEFEEFLAMMSRRQVATASDDDQAKLQREEAELRQAFRVFDIDGDGLIDADELRQTMANLGETLSEHDVQTMIREADRNGDGKVDFDEFVQMISSK